MIFFTTSKPKSYLVPERERTSPPPKSLFGWLFAIFKVRDREIINKCGLDAFFFLRYLQTLLIIFIPLGLLTLPILLPINILGGRGKGYALEFGNNPNAGNGENTTTANVTGLDVLAWGNVRPTKTNRYWAHLVLAVVCIVWVCVVFFTEMRVYIKVRQDYLTSAEHRLRASATTILVSAIPAKWLTVEALSGLYDVFPGGIRNIWINRNFGELLDKIHERDSVFKKLEGAQTELIRAAKRAQKKEFELAEKKARSEARVSKETKAERAQKIKAENQDAKILAQGGGGVSAGDPHQVPHNVDDAIVEEQARQRDEDNGHSRKGSHKIPIFGAGFAAVEKGIRKGLGEVDEFGDNLERGARNVGKGLNDQVETTNGFQHFNAPTTPDDEGDYDQYGRYRGRDSALPYGIRQDSNPTKKNHDQASPTSTQDTRLHGNEMNLPGNTADRTSNQFSANGARDVTHGKKFYEFWKPPSGGFVSPIPTGYNDNDEFPFGTQDANKESLAVMAAEEKKSVWQKFLGVFGGKKSKAVEYPKATNPEYREDGDGAAWEKYLKETDRPTHRLPVLGFLPLGKKVDTIYWGREELARLNLEIEVDQKHPERFPMMNSAFIQFNHQVAAHMAAQSVTHHVPKIMAPRITEVSPKDVIWDNMSIHWWEAWIRTAFVIAIVVGMVILWTFPVAFTSSLSRLPQLADKYPSWLGWLNNIPQNVLKAIAGVLPALVLAILLALVPMIFNWLANLQGAQTGMQKQESVQLYYFAFLFVQVFLVVSISGGVLETIFATTKSKDITSIPDVLATNLPKASNYFFSYMILQALGTSSGTLLQIVTLIMWYVLPKLFDNTARQKWTRNTTLPDITWGSYFPVYTNFACIGLIYIIVSPIIVFFAIITFTLLWVANRYNMLYVSRFQLDTGGLLYPRALNQTFTGLYFMELCLIGLFFLVRDENGDVTCFPQAIIMIIMLIFTAIYQILLNWSFGPLLRHLPITFEDEAVLRDEAFNRAQAQRLGIEDDTDDIHNHQHDGAMEMTRLNSDKNNVRSSHEKHSRLNPLNVVQGAGTWAAKSGRKLGNVTFGLDNGTKKKRRHRDLEAQAKIADALYGGYNDELEDLTPDERDVLVKHAFQHEALRARRPTIWIPRDDIGVSDDEVKRTRDFAGKNIWISNIGAALDGKCRVVYGRNPPDFSEVDLINL